MDIDNHDYERFTGPQRFDRDIHELEGLMKGIALDGRILPAEVTALRAWCGKRRRAANAAPFSELIPKVLAATADGAIDDEERADILWCIERCRTPNAYYSLATSDMQRLHGILLGVGSDGVVNEAELGGLRAWTESAEHLRGTWPYDEIDSLITAVMADGRIDEQEHRFLVAFCDDFRRSSASLLMETPFDEELIRFGVCAAAPEIEFTDRMFCFTGTSPIHQRRQLEQIVAALGGLPVPRVIQNLNYLVVCAEGTRSWAFSCYGRKVEAAIALRKKGAHLTIAHESDFWDAAADRGIERPR